jgi:hypothetical protein
MIYFVGSKDLFTWCAGGNNVDMEFESWIESNIFILNNEILVIKFFLKILV